MVEHLLNEHRAKGHRVPDEAIEQLKLEKERTAPKAPSEYRAACIVDDAPVACPAPAQALTSGSP
jgi:hypothetical protein